MPTDNPCHTPAVHPRPRTRTAPPESSTARGLSGPGRRCPRLRASPAPQALELEEKRSAEHRAELEERSRLLQERRAQWQQLQQALPTIKKAVTKTTAELPRPLASVCAKHLQIQVLRCGRGGCPGFGGALRRALRCREDLR